MDHGALDMTEMSRCGARFPIERTLAVARRAGHCWSAGMRTFAAVIPLILWLMGPTTLLVVTVIVVAFQASADFVKVCAWVLRAHLSSSTYINVLQHHAASCRACMPASVLVILSRILLQVQDVSHIIGDPDVIYEVRGHA